MRADGYNINKAGFPSVTIMLRHAGDYVEVIRDFSQNSLEDQYAGEEQLSIGSNGQQVYLQTEGNVRLMVPEEASKYILTPIIESLKITKPTA